jgi:hypothetical protein
MKEHILSEYYAHENSTNETTNDSTKVFNNITLNTTYTNIQKNDKSFKRKPEDQGIELEKKKIKNN